MKDEAWAFWSLGSNISTRAPNSTIWGAIAYFIGSFLRRCAYQMADFDLVPQYTYGIIGAQALSGQTWHVQNSEVSASAVVETFFLLQVSQFVSLGCG